MVEEVGEFSRAMAELAENQRSEFTGLEGTISAVATSSQEVNAIVRETSDGAPQVAKNSVELAAGSDEVARLVAAMSSRVTNVSSDMNQFADYSDRSSESAEELGGISRGIQQQAERLAEVTNRFKL